MKPAAFAYSRPENVEGALALLGEAGDDAKVIAGGQSLVPMLNMRLARPGLLVDINGLEQERYLRPNGKTLKIGCLARHVDFENNPVLEARVPILGRAVKEVAYRAIRNRGTFCGSLCHNDPSAEWPLLSVLLGARMHVASRSGQRTLSADEFLVDYLTTAIAPEELLLSVELPIPSPAWGWSFTEFNRRPNDFAIVSAAALIALQRGCIRSARLALGGVGYTACRYTEVEGVIEGEKPSEALWAEAGARIRAALEPSTDLQATAEFRRHLADRLTRRVLAEAAAKATETN